MKRLNSCDSLGALMSICPNSTDDLNEHGNNPMYIQTILDGLDEEGCCIEDQSGGHVSEKKRRLSVVQVKALEKNFEVENKLEPERKVKLAQELGLQPRQVAVWFQNRRARWKTKQLERDYGVLKANYDGLKLNYDNLKRDNESLLKEIEELKSKVNEDGIISDHNKVSVKEEENLVSKTEEKSKIETPVNLTDDELNFEKLNGVASIFNDLKDGSSDDSDSSAILNYEDNNNNNSPTGAISSSIGINDENVGIFHHHHHQFMDINNNHKISGSNVLVQDADHNYEPQFVKIEEHNFFGDESCSTSFFSDDQAPTLHWYCADDWN